MIHDPWLVVLLRLVPREGGGLARVTCLQDGDQPVWIRKYVTRLSRNQDGYDRTTPQVEELQVRRSFNR